MDNAREIKDSHIDTINIYENETVNLFSPKQSRDRILTARTVDDLKNSVPDIEIQGHPDNFFHVLFKVSSKEQNWFKTTKGMEIPGVGVMVQVTTFQDGKVAEALQFVPGTMLVDTEDGKKIVGII